MALKLLLLILALALSTVTIQGQDNYRPRNKDLSWGTNAAGLRMTLWTSPATDKVFGAVRNFSSRDFCYCEPLGDHFTIYARKPGASAWQEIKPKPLTPEEIEKRTVVRVALCVPMTIKPNDEIPPFESPKTNFTFFADLREYFFPAQWSGVVEIKIVQSWVHCNKGKTKLGEVESQALKIKVPFTRAAA